ncbi:MAG: sugar transferase [Patescibacteria group bacterium]|nr:sugar transferase [Patescibacteria group bacterium]
MWLTLLLRYGALPTRETLAPYSVPFGVLFVAWALVFYMAGLYGKQVIWFRTQLWGAIVRTQLLNITLAALFFFLTPAVGIAPKTTLVIYLIISLALICLWRLWLFGLISARGFRTNAALIGEGTEVDELVAEVNNNPRYPICFKVVAGVARVKNNFEDFARELERSKVSLLVVDAEHDALRAALPRVYDLALVVHRYQFENFYRLYEDIFDRVPLSLLRYDWFFRNVEIAGGGAYMFFKAVTDLLGGVVMGLITLVITPFVFIAMKFEGPGPVFIAQERIGRFGEIMRAYKFRSMRLNKAASGEWTTEEKAHNPVTRVGSFLRRTSLDEFPQFINVLRGQLSLIGPRNDIVGLGARLASEIPYYSVRYTVTPGITGWAQINQRYEPGNISPQSVEETKMRLAYDFYYIKNRSLTLDLIIALKTFKRMLFRVSDW